MNITENDKQYVAGTYARFPIELVSGKGSILKDSAGKEYIDLGSGIAVNIFGAADDEWKAAVEKQLSLLPHTSNLYYTEPCSTLAKLLCEKTGMKKVFLSGFSGSAFLILRQMDCRSIQSIQGTFPPFFYFPRSQNLWYSKFVDSCLSNGIFLPGIHPVFCDVRDCFLFDTRIIANRPVIVNT